MFSTDAIFSSVILILSQFTLWVWNQQRQKANLLVAKGHLRPTHSSFFQNGVTPSALEWLFPRQWTGPSLLHLHRHSCFLLFAVDLLINLSKLNMYCSCLWGVDVRASTATVPWKWTLTSFVSHWIRSKDQVWKECRRRASEPVLGESWLLSKCVINDAKMPGTPELSPFPPLPYHIFGLQFQTRSLFMHRKRPGAHLSKGVGDRRDRCVPVMNAALTTIRVIVVTIPIVILHS